MIDLPSERKGHVQTKQEGRERERERERRMNEKGSSVRERVLSHASCEASSVTRLGDFLLFGQAFKAGGNKYLIQSPTL